MPSVDLGSRKGRTPRVSAARGKSVESSPLGGPTSTVAGVPTTRSVAKPIWLSEGRTKSLVPHLKQYSPWICGMTMWHLMQKPSIFATNADESWRKRKAMVQVEKLRRATVMMSRGARLSYHKQSVMEDRDASFEVVIVASVRCELKYEPRCRNMRNHQAMNCRNWKVKAPLPPTTTTTTPPPATSGRPGGFNIITYRVHWQWRCHHNGLEFI